MISRAIRSALSVLVSVAMVVAMSGAAPSALADTGVDEPDVAAMKAFVGEVGTWTSGLATVGKLAEPIPSVGSSVGSVLGFPDLVQKVLKGQDPLHILGSGQQVRHYTYGGDLARGIRLAIESPPAENEDFNLSTDVSTTVLELAELIWRKVKGPKVPFRYVSDEPYSYDVQRRVPAVEKARRVLGFEASTSLAAALDEIIPWVREQIAIGGI